MRRFSQCVRFSQYVLGAAAMLAAVLAAPAAAASDGDVFQVAKVPVSAEANNATTAKKTALAEGRRKALGMLLRRITSSDDWDYLPTGMEPATPEDGVADDATGDDATGSAGDSAGEAGATGDVDLGPEPSGPPTGLPYDDPNAHYGAQGGAQDSTADSGTAPGAPAGAYDDGSFYGQPPVREPLSFTDSQIASMEEAVEVFDERSSGTTYRAIATYTFKPGPVRDALKSAGIAYSEAQTRTALVLPVLETASNLYLWEPRNPWAMAWRARPRTNELTPMIVPLGDLEDTASITPDQALARDEDALKGIAARYGVKQVIVAHAKLDQSNGEYRLHVELVNAWRESAAAKANAAADAGRGLPGGDQPAYRNPDPYAAQSTEPYEPLGPSDVDGSGDSDFYGPRPASAAPNEVYGASQGGTLADGWFTAPAGDFLTFAEQAIDKVVADYAQGWKAQTLIDHSVSSSLRTVAWYQSLGEWMKIRNALADTPFVESYSVETISTSGAVLHVNVLGGVRKLVAAMEQKGLALWSQDGVLWNIAPPEVATVVRERGNKRGRRKLFGDADDYSDPFLRPAGGMIAQPGDSGDGKVENSPY